MWLVEDLAECIRPRAPQAAAWTCCASGCPRMSCSSYSRIIGNNSNRGLPQGSPLSPLLLNIYLDHFLDSRWRKLHPDIPLLRYADDLLILVPLGAGIAISPPRSGTLPDARRHAVEALQGDRQGPCHRNSMPEWLGYQIALDTSNGRLIVTIAESAWIGLHGKLAFDHSKPQSPLRAYSTIRSWILQQGPCYPHTDRNQAYARLAEIAGELAFDEIPSRNHILSRWQRAYARWRRLGKEMGGGEGAAVQVPQESGGSACHVFPTRLWSRGWGLHGGPVSTFFNIRGSDLVHGRRLSAKQSGRLGLPAGSR